MTGSLRCVPERSVNRVLKRAFVKGEQTKKQADFSKGWTLRHISFSVIGPAYEGRLFDIQERHPYILSYMK